MSNDSQSWLTNPPRRTLSQALGDDPNRPLKKHAPDFTEHMVARVREAFRERDEQGKPAKGKSDKAGSPGISPTAPRQSGDDVLARAVRAAAEMSNPRAAEIHRRQDREARQAAAAGATGERSGSRLREWIESMSVDERDKIAGTDWYSNLSDRARERVQGVLDELAEDEAAAIPTDEELTELTAELEAWAMEDEEVEGSFPGEEE